MKKLHFSNSGHHLGKIDLACIPSACSFRLAYRHRGRHHAQESPKKRIKLTLRSPQPERSQRFTSQTGDPEPSHSEPGIPEQMVQKPTILPPPSPPPPTPKRSQTDPKAPKFTKGQFVAVTKDKWERDVGSKAGHSLLTLTREIHPQPHTFFLYYTSSLCKKWLLLLPRKSHPYSTPRPQLFKNIFCTNPQSKLKKGFVPSDKVWDIFEEKVNMTNVAETEAWLDKKGYRHHKLSIQGIQTERTLESPQHVSTLLPSACTTQKPHLTATAATALRTEFALYIYIYNTNVNLRCDNRDRSPPRSVSTSFPVERV